MERIHATSVVFCGRGLLFCGPSGAGKSDLAVRLIDAGATLIADDYTEITVRDGRIWLAPPETIKGMIEIRGTGIVRVPFCDSAPLALILNCVKTPPERMPDNKEQTLLGVAVAARDIVPFEASAVAKIRLMLQYPAVS